MLTIPHPQIVCLEEGALFDRATLCIAEAECGNDASKTALVARYRALSRFHLQQYFDSEGEPLTSSACVRVNEREHVAAAAAGARSRVSACSSTFDTACSDGDGICADGSRRAAAPRGCAASSRWPP